VVRPAAASRASRARRVAACAWRSRYLPVAIVVSFRGGLLSGERFYYDRATLLAQIASA
jgi:hypothetical protein